MRLKATLENSSNVLKSVMSFKDFSLNFSFNDLQNIKNICTVKNSVENYHVEQGT